MIAELLGTLANRGHGLGTQGIVADHPSLSNLPAPDFELGLDEHQQVGPGGDLPQPRKQQARGNERDVDGDEIDPLGETGSLQSSGIGAFEHPDTRIVAEPRVELAVADVHRRDLARSRLEQAVRKATGGRADIQADPAGGIDRQIFEGTGQFFAAPRHVTTIGAPQTDPGLGSDPHARFVARGVVYENAAGSNQGLGAGTVDGEPVADQPLVEALSLQPERRVPVPPDSPDPCKSDATARAIPSLSSPRADRIALGLPCSMS